MDQPIHTWEVFGVEKHGGVLHFATVGLKDDAWEWAKWIKPQEPTQSRGAQRTT
jgi:non-ribosomal peptide synthetase component F